jgi:hypothetical protein
MVIKTSSIRFINGEKTPEYRTWISIRRRCNNENTADYPQYGGRGIKVCERWDSFEAFLEDMGKRPSNRHSIDRIDSNADYSPENTRWATSTEQTRNTRRTRFFTFYGKALCLNDWAAICQIDRMIVTKRLARGWPVKHAFWMPPGKPCLHNKPKIEEPKVSIL